MMIREIEEKDNKEVELLIRTCLIEFGANKPGCGIGPLTGVENVCELQKMYSLSEVRGRGIANELLKISLDFAKKYYEECYLETFSNMVAANKFYKKHGFIQLDKPLIETEHYACDVWYIKRL